jgi:hypothetical protein
MSVTTQVNLGIVSAVGFRRASTQTSVSGLIPFAAFDSPRPIMTTTFTLNGDINPDFFFTGTKIVKVDPLLPFELYPGGTSTYQTVYITNEGDTPITLGTPLWSEDQAVPLVSLEGAANYPVIPPGGTSTFKLAYTSDIPGEHINWFIIASDADAPQYKLITRQIVDPNFSLSINPSSSTVTGTELGQKIDQVFEVTPIINAIPSDVIVPLITTITSSEPAWSVNKIETNELTGKQEITVQFKAVNVNNQNGTYRSTLTVTSTYGLDTSVRSVNAEVVLNIDYSRFVSLGSWISPAAPDNSVIGMSYDKIDNVRYLTIGVGMGGDGVPIYAQGGAPFTGTNALGILGTSSDYNYFAWSSVYKFEIPTGAPVRYFSGEQDREGIYLHRVKPERLLNGTYPETLTDYEQYFGLETSVGSMFIVDSDGYGNVGVALNQLRSLSEDDDLNKTLKNLTRAFHYYSAVDEPSRYYQLDAAPIQDGTVTQRFAGFNNSGTVLTSIVPLPTGF